MTRRPLVLLLGLCNLVAGALLAFGPHRLAPIDGVQSPAARLFGVSGGILLVAIAVGAWRMPAIAQAPYLWVFGVAVKVGAAVVWGAAAAATGVPALWGGALLDLAVAAIIVAGLLRERVTAA